MIHFFGDSFTAGVCGGEMGTSAIQYIDKPYGHYVAEDLKQPYKVHGLPGACSNDIFIGLTTRLAEIKKGDIIVLGNTAYGRVQIPGNHWERSHEFTMPHKGDFDEMDGEGRKTLVPWHTHLYWDIIPKKEREERLRETLPEYTGGRLNDVGDGLSVFVDDIILRYNEHYDAYYKNWFLGLKTYFDSIGVQVLYWDTRWWAYIKYKVEQVHDISKGSTCSCGHWDDLGHRLMADYVLVAIKNKITFLDVPYQDDLQYIMENY